MDTISELQDRALEVCAWLERQPRTYAAPVVCKIGRTLYAGAWYAQVRDTGDKTPAYAAGERFYCQRALYLVGRLPYAYRRSSMSAFRVPGARWPWFVAGWFDVEAHSEWHPFGPCFQLMKDETGVCVRPDGRPYAETPLLLVG